MIQFPHCASDIIHNYGICTHCDNCPDLQDDRAKSNYNFTGESKFNKLPCPHDARMAAAGGVPATWPGNLPNPPVNQFGSAPISSNKHIWAPMASGDLSILCNKCNNRFTFITAALYPLCNGSEETTYAAYARVPKIQPPSDYNDICPKCQAQAYRGFSSFECSKGCK